MSRSQYFSFDQQIQFSGADPGFRDGGIKSTKKGSICSFS